MTSDIRGFLTAIAARPTDHTARLVLADWLEENFPATPVRYDELPTGFVRWWQRAEHSRTFPVRHLHQAARRSSSKNDVWHCLDGLHQDMGWNDHSGASAIGGVPVLVSEPYLSVEELLPICFTLQNTLRCPVSVASRAAHNTGCSRLIAWFTASDLVREQIAISPTGTGVPESPES